MSSPYVGEIRMFAGNFAPQGWALCNGQQISIADNDVLYSLIGTTYGGDGQITFALPNLQSRFPVHQGNGAVIGETFGVESVTLTLTQIPSHTHTAPCSTQGTKSTPQGNVWATDPNANIAPYSDAAANGAMAPGALGNAGGAQPHDNLQPYLVVNFIISLFGTFPSQN